MSDGPRMHMLGVRVERLPGLYETLAEGGSLKATVHHAEGCACHDVGVVSLDYCTCHEVDVTLELAE